MPRRPEPPRPTRRLVYVSVALAVLAHVGVLVAISRARAGSVPRPPDVEGVSGVSTVGGLPTVRSRLVTFRIVDADSEDAPVANAVVRDVLGDQWTTANARGEARLELRPTAQLLVRVERPGFAIAAERVANGADAAGHTIHLHRAPVPYAIVDTIFIQRCTYCHGAKGHVAGIDLTSYQRLLASTSGGGPIVTPGHAEASALVRVLRDTVDDAGKRRPHARATTRVPPDEIAWIVQWVREGARPAP